MWMLPPAPEHRRPAGPHRAERLPCAGRPATGP
jgi:hypothetical protein